jgi:hypothetical protein
MPHTKYNISLPLIYMCSLLGVNKIYYSGRVVTIRTVALRLNNSAFCIYVFCTVFSMKS